MSPIEELRIILRERDCPFFAEDEIQYYLDANRGNVNNAAYDLLIVKAEDTTINLSGFDAADTSKYFRRLASRYKPCNSGFLK